MNNRYTEEHQCYQDAIQLQNACNLTAVLGTLADAVRFLRTAQNLDEKATRCHPVVAAMIYKISDLMDLSETNSTYLHDKLEDCRTWLKEHGKEVPKEW